MATGYTPPSLPGLAGATGTRVDSAAKHIMACKVDSCMLAGWCQNAQDAGNHMHVHKHKYCMTRDELVLNTNMALNEDSCMVKKGHAYPAVVTTLGDMEADSVIMLQALYHADTGQEFLKAQALIAEMAKYLATKPEWRKLSQELKNMPYFMAQGYALGIAYASALSGDTVGSVLIGGMCTVMNGAFDCRAGQMLQWYFDFEENMFYPSTERDSNNQNQLCLAASRRNYKQEVEKQILEILTDANVMRELLPKDKNVKLEDVQDADGDLDYEKLFSQFPQLVLPMLRKTLLVIEKQASNNQSSSSTDELRKAWHHRGLLGANDSYPQGSTHRKRLVAFPKPYMLRSDGSDHYGDKIRIFAKCITGARKHEMVDIMLMTQSL